MRKFEENAGSCSVYVAFILAAALMISWLLPAVGLAQAVPLPDRLELHGGQVAVYTVDRPIDRVAIGDGELVEITTIKKQQLVMIANAGGSGYTALHLWFEDGGQRTVDVHVNPTYTSGFAEAIREMLGPNSNIRVEEVAGNIVISGELDVNDAERVAALKRIYPNIVDLSHADPVGMRPMVLMDVRVMEFSRAGLRRLGIEWDSVIDGPTGGAIGDFKSSFFRIVPESGVFDDIDLPGRRISPLKTYFGIATSIGSRINLLTNSGQAWELANPQLSARSGGTANFLVGGRIPIPVATAFGQTSVQFEEYGIKLEISPVVNSDNQISASVYTEVSKIDPNVSIGGVPGFTSRETETEINVLDGETIVISGLVDLEGSDGISGIPGLSRIPILGRLFRSDEFRSGRTDLVVFVTPRVVDPNSPENVEGIEKSNRLLEGFRNSIKADIFD